MELTLYIISLLCSLAAFSMSLIKFMHFFQLNSYRAKIHTKWLMQNMSKAYINIIAGIILVVLSLFKSSWSSIFYILVSIATILLSIPKKAKKPLVYTMRVKRMLITTAVVYLAVLICGIYFDFALAGGAVFVLIAPLWVMAANLINRPIEKAINNYYINDAKKLISSSNATVIGITGSYGKTSMKYYLATLLKAKYNVLMTPESFNTPMGVVMTIRSSLNALHEIFICEMGAKRVGEIKEICDIVNPDAGIITSIGPQHLETFKSLDNIKKTKFELADSLSDSGMLYLNGNDENIAQFKGDRKNISYSVNGSAPYNATDISLTDKGTKFTVTNPKGEKCEYTTKLIGMHNVLNITGAIAVANTMGIELKSLKSPVAKLESVPHRLELINRGKDIIIDDAYNSNPSGTKAALETLSYFDGMKILLTPGMVELGEKQDELNKEFGANAAKVCDYVILVGERQAKPIYEGLKSMDYPDDKIFVANNLNEAISHAYAINSKMQRKIILLENDLPDNY
jgi:UDP-N-acetylmuramoyl-tripeptide--D-alanyl-D-alanine ligase